MLVRVATIRSAVGLKGEVKLQNYSDVSDTRYVKGNVFSTSNESYPRLTLDAVRSVGSSIIVKFSEALDRNGAEALRDTEIYLEVSAGGDGEYYYSELIGLAVHDNSVNIGSVVGVTNSGAQDLLEVELIAGGKVLVPFVKQIVPVVDTSNGFIEITPPEGLLDETY